MCVRESERARERQREIERTGAKERESTVPLGTGPPEGERGRTGIGCICMGWLYGMGSIVNIGCC